MAKTTDGCLAEEAAAHIQRNTDTVQGVDGSSAEIERQSGLLIGWALKNRALLSLVYFTGLRKVGDSTAEHVVYYRGSDDRAVKRTHAGTFGVTPGPKGEQQGATPLFYLRRLLLMNRVFDSIIRFEGVSYDSSILLGKTEGFYPCIVTSQPWHWPASSENPHPNVSEIKEFMEKLGFTEKPGSYFGWFKKEEKSKLSVVDAKRDNFIKTEEGVIPIDLVISEEPQPDAANKTAAYASESQTTDSSPNIPATI